MTLAAPRFLLAAMLAFTAGIGTPVFAQERASEARPHVRFLAERAPGDLGQVLLAAGEVRGEPFTLTLNNLTPFQSAPARAFSLLSVGKNVDLARIQLPERGTSFIILLIPAEAGYKSVVLSASDPNFRPGDVYLYNHADKPVIGYVGTARFLITPQKGQILRPAGAKQNAYYDVGFGVREEEGDRALSTTRWPVDDKVRSYVFFFVNPRTQRVDFRAVDEFVVKEPAAP